MYLPPTPGEPWQASQPSEFPDQASAQPLPDLPPFDEELPQPGTRLTFAMLGTSTGFETTSLDVNHTWLLGYGDLPPLNLTPGFGLHWWSDPVGLGLPARVYDLYFDLQLVPWQTENWSVTVGLTPGLYGDLEQVGGNTFQLTGWIVGNRQLGPHWQLLFGVAYVRQLQSTVLPVGGVIWTPHEDVRLELIVPKPKYAMRFRETTEGSLWWFVAGQLGGGTWAVADAPNDNALVGYSDLRFVTGIESFRVDGREWSLDVGYVFSRKLFIDDQQVYAPENTVNLTATIAY